MRTLHVHLDESGDFNFSRRGSKHFCFAVAWTFAPLPLAHDLAALRFALVKQGVDLPRFHATTDAQAVRDDVVALITKQTGWAFASLLVEKNKINPSIRTPHEFYPQFATMLLRFVLKGIVRNDTQRVLIYTDDLPEEAKKSGKADGMKKAINEACRAELSPQTCFYSYHHPSASNKWLQVADYCCWAISRKWERNDLRTYDQLRCRLFKSELNVTARGITIYY